MLRELSRAFRYQNRDAVRWHRFYTDARISDTHRECETPRAELGHEPMDPRDHEPNPHAAAIFPPARQLADLRIERVGDDELRTVIGRAALEVAGRLGYPELTVDLIIERAGVSRPVFYRLFADRERCFLHGYEEHAEVLVESLLKTCGSTTASGLSAAGV